MISDACPEYEVSEISHQIRGYWMTIKWECDNCHHKNKTELPADAEYNTIQAHCQACGSLHSVEIFRGGEE